MSPGLYGKLPSQGDFITRRLPWEFTSGWDEWLQAGMQHAKRGLGDRWLSCYLTAPIWRFQLAPGVLGQCGWLGFWFSSVDRVGRHFPLTIAAPLPDAWRHRYALLELDAGLTTWEDAALEALNPQLRLDVFDSLIDGLPGLGSVEATALDTVQSLRSSFDPAAVEPTTVVLEAGIDVDAALQIAHSRGPARTCYFSWGSESLSPTLCTAPTLLAPEAFAAFLDSPSNA